MKRSYIINARHRMAWHQRLFSDASTAMAWGWWLWLWSPVWRPVGAAQLGARWYPAVLKLLGNGQVDGIEHSLLALLGTSGTLLVWNRLPALKLPETKPVTLSDHAQRFGLAERELASARHAQVCVVRHDEHGQIVAVEYREAAGQHIALSA